MRSLLKYKGIHPGIVLERELDKLSLGKVPFTLSIGEYPQTINDITKGKVGIPVAVALKIEKILQWEQGTIALLQSYYDIKQEKNKSKEIPDLSILRKSLFWDTKIEMIDWTRQYKAVINRIFERGNNEEKNEMIRFYGEEMVINARDSESRRTMQLKSTETQNIKHKNNTTRSDP